LISSTVAPRCDLRQSGLGESRRTTRSSRSLGREMTDTAKLEQEVLTYLESSRTPVAIRQIVDDLAESGDSDPIDLKLAALRLVDRGRAELNKRWEFSIRRVAAIKEAVAG
jgi:hypothetical protein